MEERLLKILAKGGISSRRRAERLILEGRVILNGRVVREPSQKADILKDHIRVDGKRIQQYQKKVYLLLNKPDNTLSTVADPLMRPTVLNLIKGIKVRLYPVGRLDYHTQGVLLLTNDGELAHALLHPKNKIKRTYSVKVKGVPTPEKLGRLRKGIILEDGRMARVKVRLARVTMNNCWLSMELNEGRYREIRRLCSKIGHPALKLRRVKFGFLDAKGITPGQYRYLSDDEVSRLKALAGISS